MTLPNNPFPSRWKALCPHPPLNCKSYTSRWSGSQFSEKYSSYHPVSWVDLQSLFALVAGWHLKHLHTCLRAVACTYLQSKYVQTCQHKIWLPSGSLLFVSTTQVTTKETMSSLLHNTNTPQLVSLIAAVWFRSVLCCRRTWLPGKIVVVAQFVESCRKRECGSEMFFVVVELGPLGR